MKAMIEQLTALQKETQATQQDRMSEMTAKTQQENNVIHQLKAIVSEKESKVKLLEKELIQLKQTVSYMTLHTASFNCEFYQVNCIFFCLDYSLLLKIFLPFN